MNKTSQKLVTLCTLAAGAGLWGAMAVRFDAGDKLSYEPNPGCLKGSPYGKVLALAMQGPIDFYWHKGQSHEHIETLKAGEKSTTAHDCGHDHHGEACDHSHDHDHADHAGHAENCGCPAHEKAGLVSGGEGEKPLRALAKQKIKTLDASRHRRTDGAPISAAHEKYLQSVTEDKLRLAYELDPTNYTNYGNLHLFIATNNYGKSDGDEQKAFELARETLAACKQDEVDPSTWLTAASAAYNVAYHIGQYHERFSIPEAKDSLAEFDTCMETYRRLLQQSVEQGRIASQERLDQMQERARYLTKLRQAQGVYLKNLMTGVRNPSHDISFH